MTGKRIGFLALQVVGLAILLGLSIHCVVADDEHGGTEKKVTIEQVPAKVKAAILKMVGKNKLVDIGEITLPSGKKVYEIEMWVGGKEYDVLFDSDGKVLKKELDSEEDDGEEEDDDFEGTEKKVGLDQVPGPVKAAIQKAVGKGKLVDIGHITLKNGKVIYEIEMWVKGVEYDVVFDPKGEELSRTIETDGDDDEKGGDVMKKGARGAVPPVFLTAILRAVVEVAANGQFQDLGVTKKKGVRYHKTGLTLNGRSYNLLFNNQGAQLKRSLKKVQKSLKKVCAENGDLDEYGGKEVKVSIDAVPAAVKAAILKAVGKGKLVDIGKITLTDGRVIYEIEMKVDGKEYDVVFDSKGNVLKKQLESDDDDDDDEDDDEDDDD